jgi:glycosyltransferase involved in cell wall biosynthesis
VVTAQPVQVRGLTAYPLSAASARVRVGDFRPFLQTQGVELTHRPALRDAEYAVLKSNANPGHKAAILLRSALRTARDQQTDGLLLVQRLLLLTPFPGIDPPRHVDAYDIDDALFVGSPADANKRFQWVKQERQRAVATMRRARLVIAGNPYLAEQARTFNRRVEVVPSCVDPERQTLRQHAEADIVRIGWIGSHTTVAYLRPVLPVIARLNEHGQRAVLIVIGGDTGIRADWVEHRPWSLGRQAVDLAGLDIGIMPLPDTDWARGKSGYKILQYYAAGVPAVASPVGINAELVADGRGLAALSEADWERSLLQLMHSAEERRQRGALVRAYVETHYSYQRWAPELAALLRSLAR